MYNEIVRWGKHRLVHSVKGNSEARPILTDEQSFDVVHKLTLIWLLSCHHYHRMHNIFVGFCLRFDGFSHVKFPFVIKHNTILRKKKYLDISEKCVLFPTFLFEYHEMFNPSRDFHDYFFDEENLDNIRLIILYLTYFVIKIYV